MPTEGPGDPAAADGNGSDAVKPQEIRLAVSDIVIFMGQCGG
jgi:hypothetical protein